MVISPPPWPVFSIAWSPFQWIPNIQSNPSLEELEAKDFSMQCVRTALGKTKRSSRFITRFIIRGSYPINLTSAFSLEGLDLLRVRYWLLGQPWGQHRAGQEQKHPATWNTSWFCYKIQAHFHPGRRFQFTRTQTTHTWQAPSWSSPGSPQLPHYALLGSFAAANYLISLPDLPTCSCMASGPTGSCWCAPSALHGSLPAPKRICKQQVEAGVAGDGEVSLQHFFCYS